MSSPRNLKLSARDIDALARIVQAEAGNQPDAGKLGVLFTVLNRVAAPGNFRDSVIGVIEQPNQFEPLRGKSSVFDLAPATDATSLLVSSSLAALANGELADPTNGATFFQNVSITNQRGTNFAATEPVAVIGDHSFYNRYKLNPVVTPSDYTIEVDGAGTFSSLDSSQSGGEASSRPSPAGSSPASFASLAGADLTPHPGNPLFAYAQALGADAPLRYFASGGAGGGGDSGSYYQALAGSQSSPAASPDASPDSSPSAPLTQGQYGLKPAHDRVSFDGIDEGVLNAARSAANVFGSDLSINSGFRTQAHQDSIRSRGDPSRPSVAKNSHHTGGSALDISTAGMSMADKARLIDSLVGSGFTGIGHYNTHLHADFRNSVPSSFGTRPNWSGWTNMPEELMEVLRRRGFSAGASASSIRRGFGST